MLNKILKRPKKIMTQPKPKFPFLLMILLIIAIILLVVDLLHSSILANTTKIIAIANIMLVIITIIYALQTKKAVDYYYKRWQYDLMPLFVPLKPEFDNDNDVINFLFTNFGGLALFVDIEIAEFNHKRNYYKITPCEELRIEMKDLSEKMLKININKEPSEPTEVTFNINFQDKATRKYNQTMKYRFTERDWFFIFDESCLPKPINKNHDPI